MQKILFSRWWSIGYLQPSAPQLYTKVVFTQQIKRRLQLKTFFISTVIIVSKSFGVISMFVYKRQLLLFSIGQRARLVAKVVSWWKPCCHNKRPVIFYIFCDKKRLWFCWRWWGSLGVSGEVGRSWRYCNARPTRDEAGASSWTSSPCKNQFNIEGGTWPPYQILSW